MAVRPIRIDVSVTGDVKLQRELDKLEGKILKKYIRFAMRRAFKPVLRESKRRAAAITNPKNATELMQKVSKGMKMRSVRRKRGVIGLNIFVPGRQQLGLPAWSETGPGRFFTPAHVELGTKKLAAQNYLRGPLEDMRESTIRRFRVHLWRQIRKHLKPDSVS